MLLENHALTKALEIQKVEGWTPSEEDYQQLRLYAQGEIRFVRFLSHCLHRHTASLENNYRRPLLFRHAPYELPGSALLRNNFNITDITAYTHIEALCSCARSIEFFLRVCRQEPQINISPRDIHQVIFGDFYSWAGEIRSVGITKSDQQFLSVGKIPDRLTELDTCAEQITHAQSTKALIDLLARWYADYNHIHPFREGNGRTGMLFIQSHAHLHGLHIDFGNITTKQWHYASRLSFPTTRSGQTDPSPLADILRTYTRTLPPTVMEVIAQGS